MHTSLYSLERRLHRRREYEVVNTLNLEQVTSEL